MLATGNSSKRTVKLYKANLRITQSFHPLLGVFEVVLRNRINDVLTSHFSDPEWIINQKNGFMSDPALSYTHKKTGQKQTNNFLKREIQKVEDRLKKNAIPITSGKVIAEQTLGFWTDLFEVHHYKLLKVSPLKYSVHYLLVLVVEKLTMNLIKSDVFVIGLITMSRFAL